ncbi:NYN domain-containing protein [Roseinatronobacter bogoriensis]|uniref:RNase NYN domain-containing protein n=1 Tax=Roseinatronobacter bogoriensis subsp. barguzinensis TaxID=441209 RepID=A0A2K8K4P3_9RHOB|nr:hypothetical protein [Rhodobaca]ATX64431.1 hypothetical protein BG454_00110 [Rhodobaca barguzinensis]MBB4209133.1 hypothetical protein [Rhodobaca bogoriensis DSM 18756]TDW36339.1 Zc3h12a-like ribonuclease protein [Rhodobaca barguzinensis]TDY67533.1 Zc3h12a-like ribonuclease protein [Rhodobaca bogoriensis DSM 18756]
MRVPLVLLGLSAFGYFLAQNLPGYSDLGLLGLVSGVAALILIVRALWRRDSKTSAPYILLDGSNVMHWVNGQPSLEPVREVVSHLKQQGYRPGVVFDANAGYKLDGRYHNHRDLARKLGLSPDLVLVVNKGEPADGVILEFAEAHNARIVTNDRFRDWAEQFPQVTEPGYLVQGRFLNGSLQLDLT